MKKAATVLFFLAMLSACGNQRAVLETTNEQYDQAISAAQTLINNTTDDAMPKDALLMELGRVQAVAGKKAEAKQTFDKVIAEYPESPYIEEARRILAELT